MHTEMCIIGSSAKCGMNQSGGATFAGGAGPVVFSEGNGLNLGMPRVAAAAGIGAYALAAVHSKVHDQSYWCTGEACRLAVGNT